MTIRSRGCGRRFRCLARKQNGKERRGGPTRLSGYVLLLLLLLLLLLRRYQPTPLYCYSCFGCLYTAAVRRVLLAAAAHHCVYRETRSDNAFCETDATATPRRHRRRPAIQLSGHSILMKRKQNAVHGRQYAATLRPAAAIGPLQRRSAPRDVVHRGIRPVRDGGDPARIKTVFCHRCFRCGRAGTVRARLTSAQRVAVTLEPFGFGG